MSPASAQTCRGVALEGGGPGPSHRRQLGLQAALCVFWLQFSLMVTFPEVPLGIFLFCMCVIAIGAVQVGLPRRLPSAHACPGAAPVWRRARRVGALRAVGPRRVVRRRRGQRRVGSPECSAGWAEPRPPAPPPPPRSGAGLPCCALQRALPQALIVVYAFRFPHLLNPEIQGSAHRALYRRHVLHIVLRGPVLCLAAAGFSLFFYPAVSGRQRAECST